MFRSKVQKGFLLALFILFASGLRAEVTKVNNLTGKDVTIVLIPQAGSACKIQKVEKRTLSALIEHDFQVYAIVALGQGSSEKMNKCVLTSEDGIHGFTFFSWDGQFLVGGN